MAREGMASLAWYFETTAIQNYVKDVPGAVVPKAALQFECDIRGCRQQSDPEALAKHLLRLGYRKSDD